MQPVNIPLSSNSQLDLQLEFNVPNPYWRVLATANDPSETSDPVISAQEVSNATIAKAKYKELKIRKFHALTSKRTRKTNVAVTRKEESVPVQKERPKTAYEQAVEKV